jgi:hypothetical protein
MITEEKYNELLERLNGFIDTSSVHGDVSPTSEKSGAGLAAPDKFILTGDIDIEKLSEKEVLLAHALLHRFYASGGVNNLSMGDIEKLHTKIKEKITNHSEFDKLDRI